MMHAYTAVGDGLPTDDPQDNAPFPKKPTSYSKSLLQTVFEEHFILKRLAIVSGCGIFFALWTVFYRFSTIFNILFWLFFWSGLHYLCPLVAPMLVWTVSKHWAAELRRSFASLQVGGDKRFYWRRLVRSQFYYSGAAIVGAYLVYFGQFELVAFFIADDSIKPGPIEKLLAPSFWRPIYTTAFSAAAAHWLVTIYEDFRARRFLGVKIDSEISMKAKESDKELDVESNQNFAESSTKRRIFRLHFTSDPNQFMFKAYVCFI